VPRLTFVMHSIVNCYDDLVLVRKWETLLAVLTKKMDTFLRCHGACCWLTIVSRAVVKTKKQEHADPSKMLLLAKLYQAYFKDVIVRAYKN